MNRSFLLVSANPVEGREDEFNTFYDRVHIPEMLSVPGVVSARRLRVRQIDPEQKASHRYLTLYELEGDDPESTLKALYAANTSGRIQFFAALGPDVSSLLLEPVGEEQRAS